jgi:hypothetical protein
MHFTAIAASSSVLRSDGEAPAIGVSGASSVPSTLAEALGTWRNRP